MGLHRVRIRFDIPVSPLGTLQLASKSARTSFVVERPRLSAEKVGSRYPIANAIQLH